MRAAVARALRGDVPLLSAQPFDPDTPFWQAAGEHGVHLILADLARSNGAMREWPDEARVLVRRATADAAAADSLRQAGLRLVLDRLGAAGVPCLLMKGAALAYTLYAQPHLRPRRDTDILIRPGDASRAQALLDEAGYARAVETSGDLASFQFHVDRRGAAGTLHALDVHWRIANPQLFAHSLRFEDLDAAHVPVPALGPHARALSAPHALMLACVHREAHHPGSDRLVWLWDVHQLAASLRDRDADVFIAVASKASMRAICAHTLESAASCFDGDAARRLLARVQPEAGAPAEASARFLGGDLRLVDILRADLGQLGMRHGATLLREHLFPPAAYLRAIYPRWPAALIPAAYLHRIVRGAPKWFRRPAAHD